MRNYNYRLKLFFILLLLSTVTCKDVFEPDISNIALEILAPVDSLRSDISTQTFWWNLIEGAEYYELQVVSPDFVNISQLILDSNCTGDKFSYSFNPGKYQWRIRAANSGSATAFITRSFIIDSSSSITNQIINLISPNDNYITNQPGILFKWNSISSADNYRFRILDTLNSVLQDTIVYSTQISQNISEGSFRWQVSGENITGSTLFSTRNVIIDITPPSAPNNLSPINQDTVTSTLVQMNWNSDQSSIGDSLFIYSDFALTHLVYSSFLTTDSYLFNGLSGNSYYWFLNSIDAAGNISNYTNVYRFNIP